MDDRPLAPRGLRQSESGNVVSLHRPRCQQLFMLYAGRAGFPGVPLLRLLRETALGDRNLTLLKDPHDQSYLHGIGEDAPDFESLIAWHHQHLRERPHVSEVYGMGNSAGAMGAMMFGAALCAREVWAFSPRPARFDNFDGALEQTIELVSRSSPDSAYHVHYCPEDEVDREVAERLATCSTVTLHPWAMEANHHRLINHLIDRGELRKLFPAFSGY
ncbi:MAG: hypothetical protein AAGA68_20660 [Pseudomonadota bacterium]